MVLPGGLLSTSSGPPGWAPHTSVQGPRYLRAIPEDLGLLFLPGCPFLLLLRLVLLPPVGKGDGQDHRRAWPRQLTLALWGPGDRGGWWGGGQTEEEEKEAAHPGLAGWGLQESLSS